MDFFTIFSGMTLTKNQGYFTHRNWKSRSVGSPLLLRRLLCHSYNLFLSFLISLCRTPPFLTALTIHKGLKIGILKFFLNFSIFGPISKCVSNCPILPNFFQFCRFCPILSNFIQYFRFCPIAILQFCQFRLFCPILSILSN